MSSSCISDSTNDIPQGTVLLRIVSNTCEPFEFAVDNDQTISETRALLEVEVVGDTLEHNGLVGRAKLTFRGEVLVREDQTWSSLRPKTGDKLFVTIPNAPSARPSGIPCAAAFLKPGTSTGGGSYAENAKILEEQQHDNARQQRLQSQHQLAMMEPMIDLLANSPNMLEMMKQMSPELEQIIARNPEIAGELQNPEVLKQMMRAQHDPYALHEISTQLRLQMNHIQNIPGGSNALEKIAYQIHSDNTAPGNKTAADLAEASEANSMPVKGREANTRSLPNPWTSSSAASHISTRNNNYNTSIMPSSAHAQPMFPFQYGNMFNSNTNAAAIRSANERQLQSYLYPTSNSSTNVTIPANGREQHTAAFDTIVSQGPMTGDIDTVATTAPALPESESEDFPYHSQLCIIQEMGFEDENAIKIALKKSHGDVDAAVCMLYDGEEG